MNNNLIYFTILITLVFILSLTTIESLHSTNAQLEPFQEEIEPIPPSNNTNNHTTPMIISQ